MDAIRAEAFATVSASLNATCDAKKNCVGKNNNKAINKPKKVACLNEVNKDLRLRDLFFIENIFYKPLGVGGFLQMTSFCQR
jgi:hypothetical protein